jgi:hypothetical protein
MPSLREVQLQFRDWVMMAAAPEVVPEWITIHPAAAAERLDVYRATVMDTLARALRLSFPTVHRLVGTECFEGAARIFAGEHLPASADLNAYGWDFPDFLQQFAPCAALAYLADVARVDLAVSRALHAPDAEPVRVSALSAVLGADAASVRFTAHPSLSLLRSEYPVDEIWRAVLQQDDSAMAAIDLASGPVHLIIERKAGTAHVERMPVHEWLFANALLQGRELGAVLERAGEDVDVPALLARHLASGHLISFKSSSHKGGHR